MVVRINSVRYKVLKYNSQLDVLRGIAILLVIIEHWLPDSYLLNKYTSNGILGVSLFFTLSGFLITTDLLITKEAIAVEKTFLIKNIKIFWFKRAFRILPLYYFLIVILLIFNIDQIRNSIYWHLFFSSNYYFLISKTIPLFGPFWTLAIEQQFYIFWPLLIFFTPKKLLLCLIIIICFLGPISRVLFYPILKLDCNWLSLCSFDCLGLGAMLSLSKLRNENWTNYVIAIIISLIVLIPVATLWYPSLNPTLFKYLISTLISYLMIHIFSLKLSNLEFIFKNNILIYIGKISYSLYLLHNFVQYYWYNFSNIYFPNLSFNINLLISSLLLLVLSTITFNYIEKPFINLKKVIFS